MNTNFVTFKVSILNTLKFHAVTPTTVGQKSISTEGADAKAVATKHAAKLLNAAKSRIICTNYVPKYPLADRGEGTYTCTYK